MSVMNKKYAIICDDLPRVEVLKELCETVYLARMYKNLALEEELYRELIDVYRRPQLIYQVRVSCKSGICVCACVCLRVRLIKKSSFPLPRTNTCWLSFHPMPTAHGPLPSLAARGGRRRRRPELLRPASGAGAAALSLSLSLSFIFVRHYSKS